MLAVKEKVSGLYESPETTIRNYNNNIIKKSKKAIQFFNPDSDLEEPDPAEHPEDLSKRKSPCEELDFPKIRTSLYNQIYFFINKEEMEVAA